MSRVWQILCAGVWLGLLGSGAGAAEPAPRVPLAPALHEGAPLRLVHLDLRDAAGVELVDDPLRSEVLAAFGLRAGSPFSMAGADLGLQQVRRVASVAEASWALYESSRAGEPVLALVVRIDPSAGPARRKGWLLTGKAGDFPTFLETDRTLLRAQVNGGLGWYNDHNPWWGHPEAFVAGSPLFPDPAGAGWASWGEASLEMGLHGALQLGSRRIFAVGNVTGVGAGSRGQDPWRSDARFEVELEKAYGGLVVAPAGSDVGLTCDLRPPGLAAHQGLPLLAVRRELQRGAVGSVVHCRAHGPRAGVPGQAALVESHAGGVPRRPPGVLPERQRHAVPGPEPAIPPRGPSRGSTRPSRAAPTPGSRATSSRRRS